MGLDAVGQGAQVEAASGRSFGARPLVLPFVDQPEGRIGTHLYGAESILGRFSKPTVLVILYTTLHLFLSRTLSSYNLKYLDQHILL